MVGGEELLAGQLAGERVKCSAQCKTLHSATFDGRHGYTLYEIKDTLERAVLVAFLHDGLGSRFAKALDGIQAKPDLSLVVYAEVAVRLVHVRSHNIDSQ